MSHQKAIRTGRVLVLLSVRGKTASLDAWFCCECEALSRILPNWIVIDKAWRDSNIDLTRDWRCKVFVEVHGFYLSVVS